MEGFNYLPSFEWNSIFKLGAILGILSTTIVGTILLLMFMFSKPNLVPELGFVDSLTGRTLTAKLKDDPLKNWFLLSLGISRRKLSEASISLTIVDGKTRKPVVEWTPKPPGAGDYWVQSGGSQVLLLPAQIGLVTTPMNGISFIKTESGPIDMVPLAPGEYILAISAASDGLDMYWEYTFNVGNSSNELYWILDRAKSKN